MLYLAQVQKETRFLGLGQAKLKLLACQGTDHRWISLAGDEVISAGEANQFNPGVLVLVQLNSSKQVQRVEEVSQSLVRILQKSSDQEAKCKQLEAELAQCKQSEQLRFSLSYQVQELNRREMDVEVQQQQLEKSFEELEQQRLEIEQLWQELEIARKELDNQLIGRYPKADDAILGSQNPRHWL